MFSAYSHNDLTWALFALLVVYLTSGWARRGGRRGWAERVEEMRERAQQAREEQRAFQEQVLAELRRNNELLSRLVDDRAPKDAPPPPSA